MSRIEELCGYLRDGPPVAIQTHDHPDHDAVASAFGLQALLGGRGVPARLVYEGGISRDSLYRLVETLGIPLEHGAEAKLEPGGRIVVVDGCRGSGHVADLPGEVVASIDHHETATCRRVRFEDFRPDYGACSTIIYTYFRELRVQPPPRVATALLAGLLVDTALMTRRVGPEDLSAYSSLYGLADVHFVNSLMRNKLQTKDLSFYRSVLESVRIQDGFAFHCFREPCHPNLLAIISDFLLTLREVRFVLLCAHNSEVVHLAARSEEREWNAAAILKALVAGDGVGGGHAEMAGGVIPNPVDFSEEEMFRRLSWLLEERRPRPEGA